MEQIAISQIKTHSETWQKDLSVLSKYVIIFLIPVSVPGVNIEECNKQFKQSAKQAGDDLKYNYFLSDLST